jgi:hypothetical protein
MLMENLTHILVFKTDIKTEGDKLLIKEFLDKTPAIEEWSVDCDDVDCVLRIVSYTLSSEQIIQLITKMGFQCQELE